MILKIALMSYSFIPSKCFLPGGQLNFQSGSKKLSYKVVSFAVYSIMTGDGHFLLCVFMLKSIYDCPFLNFMMLDVWEEIL